MSVENLPLLAPQAAKLWSEIAIEHKRLLLANLWCSPCRHAVTIKNFTSAVKASDREGLA